MAGILESLLNAARANPLGKASEAVGNILKQGGQAVGNYLYDKSQENKKYGILNAPITAAQTVKDVAKPILQAAPRTVAALGLSAAGQNQAITPQGTLQKTLLGSEPITPMGTQIKDVVSTTTNLAKGVQEKYGIDPNSTAGKIGQLGLVAPVGLVFGGLEALNFDFGLGGAKNKVAGKLVQEAEERLGRKLAKEEVDKIVKNIAEESVPKLTAGVAKDVPIAPIAKEEVPQVFNPKAYIDEQLARRESERAAESVPLLQRAKDKVEEVGTKVVDYTLPLTNPLNKAEKEGLLSILPSQDLRYQIDEVLGSTDNAKRFIEDQGLSSILKTVDDLDSLDQYLIARHAQDVAANGIETGRDLVKDRLLIQALDPQYKEAAEATANYSRKLLDQAVDFGLVSKEVAEGLKTKYPNYVPLQRVFNELENVDTVAGPKSVASLSKQSVVQNLKGSTRAVENPLASFVEKTNQVFQQGERNKAAKMLSQYQNLPGNPFGLRELGEGEKVGAKHTISFLDNGKKRVFETLPEVAEAAKNLNSEQLGLLGKVLSAPMRLFKLGTTGWLNPVFGLANFTKDQIFSFITSKSVRDTHLNPLNFLESFYHTFGNSSEFQKLASSSTSFDIARDQIPETLERLASRKGLGGRLQFAVKHPITTAGDAFRFVENFMGKFESATRFKQAAGLEKKLLREGRSAADAKILARQEFRDSTTNFMRKGKFGPVFNSLLAYFNAGIQGSRKLINTYTKNPVAATFKTVAGLYMPLAAITYWNLSDPKRKELYDKIYEDEKQNNFIVMLPGAHWNEDTKSVEGVMKVPLPQGLNALTVPVRRGIEAMYGADPVKGKEVAEALLNGLSPVNVRLDSREEFLRGLTNTFVPQQIKGPIENLTNQSLFTGRQIIPKKLENLTPDLQTLPGTSATAKKIGGKLNMSPLLIENAAKNYLGSGGASGLLNLSDKLLAKAGIIKPEEVGGKSLSQNLESRFTAAKGGTDNTDTYDIIGEQRQGSDVRAYKESQEAKRIADVITNAKTKEEALAAVQGLDENMQKKVTQALRDKQSGITPEERSLDSLNVKDGAKARAIKQILDTKKSPEEQKEYLLHLASAKVLSEEVLVQVLTLMNQR